MVERFFSHIVKTILTTTIGAAVLGMSRVFYPTQEEDWVDIHPVQLPLPRLDPEFDGYRLVQISDFHIGTWMDRRRLDEAVDLVNHQSPHLVAITGDFFTYQPERFTADLIAALRRLKASDGVVAVLGNHDHWTDPQLLRQALRSSGIIDLSNSVHTVHRGAAQLHIAGVDDFMEKLDRLDLVLDRLPSSGAAILLVHEPDYADISASTGRFDLQLSGHTHGGQICIPRIKPPVLPRFGRKYPSGMYRVGDMIQYTNRGLGTAEFQVRLNCRPEITVFHLESPFLLHNPDSPVDRLIVSDR